MQVLFAIACGFLVACLCMEAYAAGPSPESLVSFDLTKGFKPAQTDLTAIYLQIAGSLEYYGTPLPYLRHIKAEHERIEAKYRQQCGGGSKAYWPTYIDNTYFERFEANWKLLEPKLKLESLAKDTGHWMLAAINASPRNDSATLKSILSEHQARVHAAMSGEHTKLADFDALKAELVTRLNLDQPVPQNESDDTNYDPVHAIHAEFSRRFAALDAGPKAADAERVKAVLLSLCIDTGRVAEAELEAAIIEQALDRTAKGYSAEQETALTAQEQKTFAEFLKKPRFTRADFPDLEKFYKGPYDRLSERGKDEMSQRIQAGTQPSR